MYAATKSTFNFSTITVEPKFEFDMIISIKCSFQYRSIKMYSMNWNHTSFVANHVVIVKSYYYECEMPTITMVISSILTSKNFV